MVYCWYYQQRKVSIMNTIIRRLASTLVMDDPNPQTSQLDRLDRPSCYQPPLCSVLGCTETPVMAPHGWQLCQQHSPRVCVSGAQATGSHSPARV